MTRSLRRGAAALITAPLLALVLAGGADAAEITSSSITSPPDLSFVSLEAVGQTTVVSGTATGSATKVDLKCYYGNLYVPVADDVPVVGGSFSATVSRAAFGRQRCLLRAVTPDDNAPKPPGSASPYTGPQLGPGLFATTTFSGGGPNNGTPVFWSWPHGGGTYNMKVLDAGSCGLDTQASFNPTTLASGGTIWNCAGLRDYESASSPSRSGIRVDGANAYLASAWFSIPATKYPVADPQAPTLAITAHGQDPVTGHVSVDEIQTPSRCATNAYPPTAAGCAPAARTGVQLARHTETLRGGQVVRFTDTWSSTDGQPHQLDLLPAINNAPSLFQVNGQGTPGPVSAGQSVGPDQDAPTRVVLAPTGMPDGSAAAAVLDPPPSDLRFHADTAWSPHQVVSVPATGTVVLHSDWITAPDLGSAQTLAERSADAARAPTLTFDLPAENASISDTETYASGTVSDPGASVPPTVTVQGVVATVANGSWTARVPVPRGVSTLTATATDGAGHTVTASRTVRGEPMAPPVDRVPPKLTGVALSPKSFRVGRPSTKGLASSAATKAKTATKLRWTVNEPAVATFTVLRATAGRRKGKACLAPSKASRKARRCTRYVKATVLRPTAAGPGKHVLTYTGRVKKKPLRAGRYRLEGRATDVAGNLSKVAVATFTVLPARR